MILAFENGKGWRGKTRINKKSETRNYIREKSKDFVGARRDANSFEEDLINALASLTIPVNWKSRVMAHQSIRVFT